MRDKNWRWEKYKRIYDDWIKFYPLSTDDLPHEVWKDITGYEGLYQVSTYGRVKSFNGRWVEEKILKPQLGHGGYLSVCLYKGDKGKRFFVSRLVGAAFIPNPESKPELNHIFSCFNNHMSGLEWVTRSENMTHAYVSGLVPAGEEHYRAKLTNEQVVYIRQNPDRLAQYKLANMFDVSQSIISSIQTGKSFKSAGGKIREVDRHPNRKLPVDARNKIREIYSAGDISMAALAEKYGVCAQTICNIVNRIR